MRCFSRMFCGPWLLLVALTAAHIGCGNSQPADPNRAVVAGAVTFDGKPLPAGIITFTSADNALGTALPLRTGGRYATDRVPIGSNLVSISTDSIKMKNAKDYVAIPAKYADASKSGLKVDVKAGLNENINFDLKK